MIDVRNEQERSRLWSAIKRSRETLDLFDGYRSEILRDYGGPLYSPYGSKTARYVNKLNTTANIYATLLAFSNPECRVTSFSQELLPTCRKLEALINRLVANIDLKTTLQECVLDAFFLLGAVKVHMMDAGDKELEPNQWVDLGKPWVDRISFSDLVLDLPAKSLRSMRFYGDRYRASWNAVRERKDFDKEVREQVTASPKLNQQASAERSDQIALGNSVEDDDLEPQCWLMDIFLPREKLFVTLAADHENLAPLKVSEWDGSEQGPYKFLALGYMPDNVMPSTPAQQLALLDRLMNRLYRKLRDQAVAQKNIYVGPKGSEADLLAQKDAVNNEYRTMQNPKDLTTVVTPGPDANVHNFFLALNEVYNTQSGNERALAGLGTEAETLGQEEMLARGANGRVAFMKGAVVNFAADILREMGGLVWKDDYMTMPLSLEAENTGYYLPEHLARWTPSDRKGVFDHYDFHVKPVSMGYKTDDYESKQIDACLMAYMNLLPAIQAGVIDGMEWAKAKAQMLNLPQLVKIIKAMQDGAGQGGGDPHQATKPANTSREVVRRSVSSGPQGGGLSAVIGQAMQGNQNRQPQAAGSWK
jgi:hypothetical protein